MYFNKTLGGILLIDWHTIDFIVYRIPSNILIHSYPTSSLYNALTSESDQYHMFSLNIKPKLKGQFGVFIERQALSKLFSGGISCFQFCNGLVVLWVNVRDSPSSQLLPWACITPGLISFDEIEYQFL
jgi:hypothetical protein